LNLAGGCVFTNIVGTPFTAGTLDLAGNVALHVAATTQLVAGQYPIINFAALTGSGPFTSLSVGGAGLSVGATASVVVDTSSVYLNVVGGGPAPTNITYAVIAGQLVLDWPAGQGWQLQGQTNNLGTGLSNNWFTVPNAVPPYTNAIGAGNPAVFYRLTY
jgi:hypothetical protein